MVHAVQARRRVSVSSRRLASASCARRLGGDHLAQGPGRPTDMVADVRVVQPAPFVVHEVVHAECLGSQACSRKASEDASTRRVAGVAATPFQPQRHDGQPGHVVDAVAGRSIRDRSAGVLDDADVIDQGAADGPGGSGATGDGNQVGALDWADVVHGFGQHLERGLAHAGPGQVRPDPPRLGRRPQSSLPASRAGRDRRAQAPGVAERHQNAGAGAEQVLRVEVGGGDHRAAGGHREGERARDDLFAASGTGVR